MPRVKPAGGSSPAVGTNVLEQAERIFLQMRLVKDTVRNLIADIDKFEEFLVALRVTVPERDESPEPLATSERQSPRVLRIADVAKQVGLSRSTIYRLQQEGTFPVQVRLSERAVAWNADEITAWLASRMKVVRRIFRAFVAGVSPKAIARP